MIRKVAPLLKRRTDNLIYSVAFLSKKNVFGTFKT